MLRYEDPQGSSLPSLGICACTTYASPPHTQLMRTCCTLRSYYKAAHKSTTRGVPFVQRGPRRDIDQLQLRPTHFLEHLTTQVRAGGCLAWSRRAYGGVEGGEAKRSSVRESCPRSPPVLFGRAGGRAGGRDGRCCCSICCTLC